MGPGVASHMIALLAVVLAFSPGGGSGDDYTQTVLASAPLKPGGEIEVDDEYGDVHVMAGASGIVKVQAVKHARSASELNGIDVHVDAVEGAVKVSTTYAAESNWFHQPNRNVEYTIDVPPTTKVIVRLTYGDGSIDDVMGP